MAEAVGTCVTCGNFLEFLKTLPWCRQGDSTLIAVHNCTPDLIEAIKDHEVKVFPGGMQIKLNLSWLLYLKEKFDEGRPLPMVIVWKPEAIELWYRRNKSWDFPYDAWQDSAAAAYDRERVKLPAEHAGEKYMQYHADLISKAKECPTLIPPQ